MEQNEDEDENLIPDQIQNLGYDEYSPLRNLGTMAYITGFYFLKVLFLGVIIGPIKHYTRYGQSIFRKMYKKLFFGEILLIIVEGYLDFTLSYFIYIKFDPFKHDVLAEKNDFSESCMYIIIVLIFMITPATMLYVISQKKPVLESEDFMNRFGSLYSELKISSK